MMSIDCPSCRKPMGIDENDLDTEWECPVCAAAFRVQKSSDGSLQFQITLPSPDTSAIQTEPTKNIGRHSRRRLNRANVEAPAEEPDLNIGLTPQSPFQSRFPDLVPSQPPVLFTFNGLGTMMYGSRDWDDATRTYVSSACLVVFFVPIFVIGSYRVADAPAQGWLDRGGWHVLGSVPLSPLAKAWNWIMLAVIVVGLLSCMFSIR
jgi:hypothetical protein